MFIEKLKKCPATSLPLEILSLILEAREEEMDLITATHVCRQWRNQLKSAKYLWTKINFNNFALSKFYIELSGTAPIDVTIENLPGEWYRTKLDWVARMKSLCIQNDRNQTVETIARQFCSPAPMLESLRIKGNELYSTLPDVGVIDFPKNFLGQHAPLLRSLTFCFVSPRMVFTFPLPRLTHIDWVAKTAPVAIKDLLRLFTSSSELEVIKMHVWVQGGRGGFLGRVALNHLHRLDWTNSCGSVSLVPYLIAPQLTELKIKVFHNHQSQGTTTLSSILSPDGHCIPSLLEPTTVQFIFELHNQSCHFGYSKPTTSLHVSEVGDFGLVPNSWFSQYFPFSFSKTQQLTVIATDNPLFPDNFPFGHFGELDELYFIGKADFLIQMIEVKENEPIPFPTLSKIYISIEDNSAATEKLGEVLNGRGEAGHKVKDIQILKGVNGD